MNAIAEGMRNHASDLRQKADEYAKRMQGIPPLGQLDKSMAGIQAEIDRLTEKLGAEREARDLRAWLAAQRDEHEAAAVACHKMAAEHEKAFAPRPAAEAVAVALPPADDIGGPDESAPNPLKPPLGYADAVVDPWAGGLAGLDVKDGAEIARTWIGRHVAVRRTRHRRDITGVLTDVGELTVTVRLDAPEYGAPVRDVPWEDITDIVPDDGPDFGPDCCADCGTRLGGGHLDGCPQVVLPDVPPETLTQAVVPVVTRDEPAEPAEPVDYGALRGKHVVIRYRDGGWEDGTLTSYDRDRVYLNDQPTGAERALILRVEPADQLVATSGPSMTMPDVGTAPAPLPPAEEADGPRHEKPKPEPDTSASTRSGAFRSLMERAGLMEPKGDGTGQDGAPSDE